MSNIYHTIKLAFSLTLFSTISGKAPWLFKWIAKIIYSVKNISVYILNVSLFALIPYHISADHRSLPAAHHEKVCDYSSSIGSFRSLYST